MSDAEMSDGEGDQAGNESAEIVKHDDFDYSTIFDELSKKAPKMEDIMTAAKKFDDGHRHLINKFIFEASMRTNKVNLIFARYITTVKFKKHPEAVMRIKATPEQSRDLTKILVKTLNKEKGKNGKGLKPWRFVMSSEEKTPKEYVTMTGCTENSTIISDASDMKKEERLLMLTILEQMMRGDGTVPLKWVHEQTKQDPCKMVETRYDGFITKMSRLKYFSVDMESETLEITPRVVVELDTWLRAKLVGEIKICDMCRKIIARPIFSAECTSCKATSHFNCFKNATMISNRDGVECQKCKTVLTLDEVNKQMKSRKTPPPKSSSSRTSQRKSTDSDDGEDVEPKQERIEDEDEEDAEV